jgi:hypothetical protein
VKTIGDSGVKPAARTAPPALFPLTSVILTQFVDSVVIAKVAMVAIFPNVASVGIEERVVTAAVRELDAGEASLRQGGLGLKDWFQDEHRKQQSDDREDRLRVKVNAHMSASRLFSARLRASLTQHF